MKDLVHYFIAFTLSFVHSSNADLIISEFLASSSGTSVLDEDLEDSDWIEIHNSGSENLSLLGYRLTDDPAIPSKWVFPNVSLAANSYLLVFASDKNRATAGNELHTNFKLSAGGEYLSLLSPSGTPLTTFDPSFPPQEEDISYGLGPDGMTLGYFATPSPGGANTISPSGQVADTQFSVQRGIFESAFSLQITTETPEAEIRYTLDGSTPTANHGSIYTSPLSISSTSVVRAAAFKPGFFPTNVDTQSYLFPSDIRTQYANGSFPSGWPSAPINNQVYDYGMDPEITNRYSPQEMEDALTAIPSVVITSDVGNFTNATDGIYSNPTTRGLEKPAHVEFIGGPENFDVSARCGLRLRGGFSRRPENPKHSFRLFFKAQYGDPKLDFPLFGPEGVDEFDKLDFRTAQNYSWSTEGDIANNTFLRDVLARDLQGASGQPYTRSRYFHLYLNGIYWGLFMSQERPEANWGSSYLGGNDQNFDTIKSSGDDSGYDSEATDGDFNGSWKDLWDLVQDQVSSPSLARYLQMQGLDSTGQRDPLYPVLLDVDNLIDYMLLIGYTGAYDSGLSDFSGASNNWYSVRNFVKADRGFVHLLHDVEHSLGAGYKWDAANDRINTTNGIEHLNDFSKSNPQFLHIKLAQSTPEYRQRFADRAHAALFNAGYLTKDRVLEALEKRRQVVDSVIIAESARWGDFELTTPADKEDWENAVQSLVDIIDTRDSIFLGHLRTGSLYPSIDAPTFGQLSSTVSFGDTIEVAASEGILYYTTDGSDPRLPNNNINPTASSYNTNGTTNIGFSKNSTWKYNDSGANLGSSDLVQGNPNYNSLNWKHPDYDDSNWSSGPAVLGYGDLGDTPFAPIATTMGQNSGPSATNPITSYLRHSFTVNNPSFTFSLTGSLLADDGVIVYLNGIEVHRLNMREGSTLFDDLADDAVTGSDESVYSPFILDPSLLVDGTNIIAVELHQVSADSSDLGFDMELVVDQLSSIPLAITSPQTINARVLSNGEWSALSSNYYTIGRPPESGDLLLSEVHYHPASPSLPAELAVSNDKRDFEFIELVNISQDLLELQGCALAEQVINDHLEGVRFRFSSGKVMAPGERLIVVSHQAAFLARYPTAALSVAGEFSGNLGNSGEWLRLVNAQGSILSSFRYNDLPPWPIDADGNGFSLQLTDLSGNLDYQDPLSWMAITSNGSPGETGPGLFVGDFDADFDNDGIPALLEYFSGTNDLLPSNRPNFQLFTDESSGELHYTFTRDPEVIGLTSELQHSTNLASWESSSLETQLISRQALPDGTVKETYSFHSNSPQLEKEFFRINLTLQSD